MKVLELENHSLTALRQMARDLDIPYANRLKKEDLILKIQQVEAERQGLEIRGGILEIMNEGIGFLRSGHYQPGPYDVYVSQSQIRRYNLRNGDMIIGQVRPPREFRAALWSPACRACQRDRSRREPQPSDLRITYPNFPGAAF